MLLLDSLISIVSCIFTAAVPCIKNGNTEHCYQIVDTNTTWAQAFNICMSDGGTLTNIESAEEQHFIAGLMLKRTFTTAGLWIGSGNLHPERTWVNGKKFTYLNWAEGEPNNYQDEEENCAEIYTDERKGLWNDNNCIKRRGYICENARKSCIHRHLLNMSSDAAEPCIQDGNTGYCYQIVDTNTTWTQAFNICRSDGGMLIIIESAEEQQFVEDLMRKRNFTVAGLWIGADNLNPEKHYTWANGAKFSYVNWARDQPNNSAAMGACAEMRTADMKWVGRECTDLIGYICENTTKMSLGASEQCIRFREHCYHIVDTKLTWTDAYISCFRDNGMLIIIESFEEQQFIEGLLQKRNFTVAGLWIGSDNANTKERTWVNGKKFSYANWAEENCGEIYTYDMKWNDLDCTNLRGYICENTRTSQPVSQPYVLIISIAVVSALVLLVGVLLLYCLIQKRNKYKKKKREETYQEVQEMETNREYSGVVEDVYHEISDLPDTYSTIDDNSVRLNESTDKKEIY